MKKTATAFLIALCAITGKAQTTGHMQFLGTEINGTVKSFVSKMEGKGFKLDATIGNDAVMTGKYKEYEGCTLYIQPGEDKDLVATVGVTLDHRAVWDSLYADYSAVKAKLTAKYGKPKECTEKFNVDSATLAAGNFMQLAKQGKCDFFTVYKTPAGTINLSISTAVYEEETVCFVQFDFIDKKNITTPKQQ